MAGRRKGSVVAIAGFGAINSMINDFKQAQRILDMEKKRRGPPVTVKADDKLIPGSIRLSVKQWDKFKAWGGAEELRKVLNASRVKA